MIVNRTPQKMVGSAHPTKVRGRSANDYDNRYPLTFVRFGEMRLFR